MVETRTRTYISSQVMSPRRDSPQPNSERVQDVAQDAHVAEVAVQPAPTVTLVESQLEGLLTRVGSALDRLTEQQLRGSGPAHDSQRLLFRDFAAEPARPRRAPPYGQPRGDPLAEGFPVPSTTSSLSAAATPAAQEAAAAQHFGTSTSTFGHAPTDFSVEPAEGETGMAGQHRCVRCMNASNHVAPNARLDNENYKTWRAEMCVILDASNLLPPLLGQERIEDQQNDAQRRCFTQRLRVAQREIVMALSEELQGRFSDVIERADPLLLWRTLREHFDNHPGVNAVFLKRDMLNRRLQSNEPLNKYFDDMDHFKQQLRRRNQPLPDNEAVSVLLFNTIGVYPAVVNEHEVRLARGEDITWEQAIERLRLAEHARQEADNQQGRGGRVAQRDVAFVGNHGSSQGHGGGRRSSSSARNNQRRRSRGRSRGRSRSHSPRRSNKRHRSNSTVRSNDSLAKRKAKTKCNACGEVGHWRGDPVCRQQGNDSGNSDRQRPANMANVVIVKNNKSAPEKKGVLAVRDSMDVQRASADMVEWILDSGAAGSVTGDLTLFTELREDATSELLFGNEERLLDDVSYSKSTPFNLISQTYMQFACGFKLRLSEDQRTMWLVKDSLKLRFDYDR
ncbi:Putative Polyprotein, partial [Phytophthora palmivora]